MSNHEGGPGRTGKPARRKKSGGSGEQPIGEAAASPLSAASTADRDRNNRRRRPAARGGKKLHPAEPASPPPAEPDLLLHRLLYRDGLVLIIDKPAGLPVHAGPGGGANVEQYLEALRFGLPGLPALAHRLDRDTSGCLVLGRHHKALRKLGLLFSGGQVDKTYWAIVEGRPPADQGTIDLPLKKVTQQKGWRMLAAADGQSAVTDYRLLGGTDTISWLELKPRTGRTHQIRVHCAELGCALVGDPAYGPNAGRYRTEQVPLHLLARRIGLPLYPKRAPITATAAPPPHMLAALRLCGYVPETDTATGSGAPGN
ncbi:MAG TPA: RNA pseudouridine synthase [Dongiaceae bacterium]|nr:RNA pseudouridine synthase [Dongiaceae bacterium]